MRTRSSIRRPKGRSSIPQSIRLPGPGSGGRVAMLIHSWNEVILVVEASHTNMSKLYDYARSHIWGRCGRTGYWLVDVSTKTQCAFFRNRYHLSPFINFHIDDSASHSQQGTLKGVWNKPYFSHPIVQESTLKFYIGWQNSFSHLL